MTYFSSNTSWYHYILKYLSILTQKRFFGVECNTGGSSSTSSTVSSSSIPNSKDVTAGGAATEWCRPVVTTTFAGGSAVVSLLPGAWPATVIEPVKY